MHCTVHGVAKSCTRLSDFHFHVQGAFMAGLGSSKYEFCRDFTFPRCVAKHLCHPWAGKILLEKGKATHSRILA